MLILVFRLQSLMRMFDLPFGPRCPRVWHVEMSDSEMGMLYSLSFNTTLDSRVCCSWLGACSFWSAGLLFPATRAYERCWHSIPLMTRLSSLVVYSSSCILLSRVFMVLSLFSTWTFKLSISFCIFFICTDCLHRNLSISWLDAVSIFMPSILIFLRISVIVWNRNTRADSLLGVT